RLLLVNWLLSSCWDVRTFVVPVLGHERAFSASVIGAILGSFAIAATCVRFAMPLLAAHLREWAVLTSAMLLTAALFGIYPLLHTAWAMGMCSVLLGLALGSVQPMVMSTLHQITPPALHGQAIGLRLMGIKLSSLLMLLLFGAVGLVVGVSVVFWTVGVAARIGARGEVDRERVLCAAGLQAISICIQARQLISRLTHSKPQTFRPQHLGCGAEAA
ncbi:MAG: MFS transporter, partial [Rhodoferax sp.]|nr:MFS transporter [Rhodoferax sp.]